MQHSHPVHLATNSEEKEDCLQPGFSMAEKQPYMETSLNKSSREEKDGNCLQTAERAKKLFLFVSPLS